MYSDLTSLRCMDGCVCGNACSMALFSDRAITRVRDLIWLFGMVHITGNVIHRVATISCLYYMFM